jgi:hypothetical protein
MTTGACVARYMYSRNIRGQTTRGRLFRARAVGTSRKSDTRGDALGMVFLWKFHIFLFSVENP